MSLEELLYKVSTDLAVWPAEISAHLSSINFELESDDGVGVRRCLERPRTRSFTGSEAAAGVDALDAEALGKATLLADRLGDVNHMVMCATEVISSLDGSSHRLQESDVQRLVAALRRLKIKVNTVKHTCVRVQLPTVRSYCGESILSFCDESVAALNAWNVSLTSIHAPQRTPVVTSILGSRGPEEATTPSSVEQFLETFDVPSAFRIVDFTDSKQANPVVTPQQTKQMDKLRAFDTNITPLLAREIILAYNLLGKTLKAQHYWIGHISAFLSASQKQVLLLAWHGLDQTPGGIALPRDVYDLQPVDVEVLLYSCILNATAAEQEALQQTAIAQIEARALSTFADKLWKDTWGARVFFAQFNLVLQELGLTQVVEDFPATERAYVELLMTFLPSDGKKAIISISKSTDKEVLRKLDHFTAAVTKWHEVVWAFQLLQQSSSACSARELRRFDRDNRPSFPSITRVLRTTVEDAQQQPSRHQCGNSGPTPKCAGCGGAHWFMEVRGDRKDCKYRITCDKRYHRTEFNRLRSSAFEHLFKKPFKPMLDVRRVLSEFPKKTRKRICMALLELESAEASSGDDSDTECLAESKAACVDVDPVASSVTDSSDCYSVQSTGSFNCSAAVHAIQVCIRSAKLRPSVRTYVLLSDQQFEILVALLDSGAQATLIGNKFLVALVSAGAFETLAEAVAQLQPSPVPVEVSGVHGTTLTSNKFMKLDLAITLDGASAANPASRVTVRSVHAYYHPDFPTVVGDDVLLPTGLVPECHIKPIVGRSFQALPPAALAARSTGVHLTDLRALESALPVSSPVENDVGSSVGRDDNAISAAEVDDIPSPAPRETARSFWLAKFFWRFPRTVNAMGILTIRLLLYIVFSALYPERSFYYPWLFVVGFIILIAPDPGYTVARDPAWRKRRDRKYLKWIRQNRRFLCTGLSRFRPRGVLILAGDPFLWLLIGLGVLVAQYSLQGFNWARRVLNRYFWLGVQSAHGATRPPFLAVSRFLPRDPRLFPVPRCSALFAALILGLYLLWHCPDFLCLVPVLPSPSATTLPARVYSTRVAGVHVVTHDIHSARLTSPFAELLVYFSRIRQHEREGMLDPNRVMLVGVCLGLHVHRTVRTDNIVRKYQRYLV